MSYEEIARQSKLRNCKTYKELLVMAPQNDPFFAGRRYSLAQGKWFANLWREFGYTDGVHLRRVHYRLVSGEAPVLKPNGTPYQNSDEDWQFLGETSKQARYLGFVEPEAFKDKRGHAPQMFPIAQPIGPPDAFPTFPEWQMPHISTSLSAFDGCISKFWWLCGALGLRIPIGRPRVFEKHTA